MTGGLRVAILDTGERKHLLGDGGADDAGTSGSGHKLDTNGSALASDLAWHGMDVTDLVTPIAATDGHELELGVDESALDGDLHLLADLDAETDVASHVTDGDNSLEARSLTGLRLLLDRDDLHDVVLELVLGVDELVDDASLLDGDRVRVDLLQTVDVLGLDETAELGLGVPFVLGGSATAAGTASAATTATEASASATITAAITAISTTAFTTATSFSGLSFHRSFYKCI